jgi:hypothetical protein
MRREERTMSAVLDLYDRLRHAPDEETRARVIAEAFDLLESRYPHLDYLVTVRHLSETELKLTKEIEAVRGEVKATELKLTKEIEQVRADLTKEIEAVRAQVAITAAETRSSILKWSFLFWLSQFGAVMLLLWRLWPHG